MPRKTHKAASPQKRLPPIEVGMIFERLTVIAKSETRRRHWLCRCVCDGMTEVRNDHLINKKTRSCGCLVRERSSWVNFKHGHSGKNSPTKKVYRAWYAMVQRCTNEDHPAYEDYGGRQITVCERWLGEQGMENFLADMGVPLSNQELDRKDNEKGYSPENCRWATRTQQMRNTRATIAITFDGETKPLQTWAEEMGMNPQTLYTRIFSKGWDVDRAMTQRLHQRVVTVKKFKARPPLTQEKPPCSDFMIWG